MMKKISILILAFLVLPSFSYSQSKYKNPFESLLPQEKKEKMEKQEGVVREEEDSPPDMVVQGILWGSNYPQVIIDGEVYESGDSLKGVDAQVFKIEKGEVFISYGDEIYRIKINEKGEL